MNFQSFLRPIFFFSVFLAFVLPASARLDVNRASLELIILDGIVYVKSQVDGMILVGGVWVDPTGSRWFYAENRLPNTQAEWDQLIADVARGGPAVTDFLNQHFASIMASTNGAGVVSAVNQGLIDGNGLLESTAETWLTNAFASVLSNNSGDDYTFSALDLRGYELSGYDLSNLGLTGLQLSVSGEVTGSNLRGLNLQGFVAGNRNFDGTIFEEADLTGSVWTGLVNFSNLDLRNTILAGANFARRVLTGVQLGGAVLTGAGFMGATSETDTGGDFSQSYNQGSGIFGVTTAIGNWIDTYVPPIIGNNEVTYYTKDWEWIAEWSADGKCYYQWGREIWVRYLNIVAPDQRYDFEYKTEQVDCAKPPCKKKPPGST